LKGSLLQVYTLYYIICITISCLKISRFILIRNENNNILNRYKIINYSANVSVDFITQLISMKKTEIYRLTSALMSFRIEGFHSRARFLNKKKEKKYASHNPTRREGERERRVRGGRSLRIVSFDGCTPRSRRRSAIRERAR